MSCQPWLTTSVRGSPDDELSVTQCTINRVLSAARASFEPGVARLKSWRIF
jgi:hypothetical protein